MFQLSKFLPNSNLLSTEVEIFGSLGLSSESSDPEEDNKRWMKKIRCIVLEFKFDLCNTSMFQLSKFLPNSNFLSTEVEIFPRKVLNFKKFQPQWTGNLSLEEILKVETLMYCTNQIRTQELYIGFSSSSACCLRLGP